MSSRSPETAEASSARSQPAEPAWNYLAISATFTAEPVEETLRFWLDELGLKREIRFAPYNQVFQQMLDPASILSANRGINILLVRLEDWSGGGPVRESIESNVRHFVSCLPSAAANGQAPFLVFLCPASPEALGEPGNAAFFRSMEELIRCSFARTPSVYVIGSQELRATYPVGDYFDPHGNELGHIPYTPVMFAALGTFIARKVHALERQPYKVIVLDCDDTLWKGICGEDGPTGVEIDEPRRRLQEFMVAQHDAGMLLCLCSKNNEEDVIETFRANPAMPLRIDHITSRRINWDSKAANLSSLASELGLGLDSFIFVDDNPKECAEVQADCPEVLAVPLPADAGRIPAFLSHVWAFDHLRTTEEDRKRSAMYAQQAERSRLEKQAGNLEVFIASLNLEVTIAPMTAAQLSRVSQLTQRTNQMNFTTIRRTEPEIQALVQSGSAHCLAAEVKDRFGDYGLVGVVIYTMDAAGIAIDTFLLSCRALGRGVEHRMLAHVAGIAQEHGIDRVRVRFQPTAKNRPASEFLQMIGAEYREPAGQGFDFVFPAAYLANLRYTARSDAEASNGAAASPAPAPSTVRPAFDVVRIAGMLSDPESVLDAVRQRRGPQPGPTEVSDAPRTPLERQLTGMWARLLGRPAVGIHENFFDLGGHSLLAVQLLSAVRQAFDVELSLKIVYAGAFTVAELAKEIELLKIAATGADDYGELLAEIENLSDEEVAALLAAEEEAERGDASE